MSQRRPWPILMILSVLLSGCQIIELVRPPVDSPVEATTTPTQSAPTLERPSTTPTPAELLGEVSQGSEQIVLTVWTVETLAPSSEVPGGQVFLEQLAAFEETYPDIQVEVLVKRLSGPGSMLAYLRSAPPVAPSILPDLALMDRETMLQAARESLIVPLEQLLDPAIRAKLYPVAEGLGTVDGTLVGLPYLLEVQHIVYREPLFDKPPNSFEAILNSPVAFNFPAAARTSINQTTLLQYLAAGGRLTDANGAPYLDVVALQRVLSFYASARQVGTIDPALFQLTDPAETWAYYRDRQNNLAAVTSTLYLSERDQVRNTGLSWIPTPDGAPFALASGWSWVMVTQDPDRQAAAMLLINFLLNPVNQGTYSQAAHWLPSQPAALAVWGDTDPYVGFANQLLNNAQPLPDQAVQAVTGAAIQDAFEAVMLNNVLPAQAANQAGQTINPPGTDG